MTNPRLAVDVNYQRYYRNPNRHGGAPVYPSVTNICNRLPKYGLPRWAANVVAEYAVSYLESWQQLPAMDAVDLLKRVPWQTRDRAAAKGTEVHAVIEKMIAGEEFTVEAQIQPWIGGAQKFVNECLPRPLLMEATCYNEKHLHAGTIDFEGWLGAFPELGLSIIDWKTGKDIYPDMGVQLVGGYALGADYTIDDNDKEIEWRMPTTALLVHLTAESYEIHNVPMHNGFRRAFLAAREIAKWEKDGPKVGPGYRAPDDWNMVYLKQLIRGLDTARALEVSTWCHDHGIPTKPAVMTDQHVEQVVAFIKLLAMQDETEAQQPRAILRPMP
jgi:hypothetical protein